MMTYGWLKSLLTFVKRRRGLDSLVVAVSYLTQHAHVALDILSLTVTFIMDRPFTIPALLTTDSIEIHVSTTGTCTNHNHYDLYI